MNELHSKQIKSRKNAGRRKHDFDGVSLNIRTEPNHAERVFSAVREYMRGKKRRKR